MGKGSVILAVSAALLQACGGVAGNIPADFVTYGFEASVEVATAQPVPGRRVDFIVAVTSIGNVPVECDVTLRVVSEKGEEIYAQRGESVKFMPDSPWNLQNGFLPATDVEKSYKLSVEVRRHANGELLYENAEVSRLEFPAR
jgi:hypothetical protein